MIQRFHTKTTIGNHHHNNWIINNILYLFLITLLWHLIFIIHFKWRLKMFCPICRSFLDSPKNHCSACGTIVDLDSITKSKKQNKITNSSSKRKSKKQNKRVKVKITKPKTKKAAKKNRQKKKSKKGKRQKTKKAQKPSAKRAMLADLRNYISKNPNKKKKSKKGKRQKTKSSNPNGKSKRKNKSKRKRGKKIRQTKTNTTIKSKTGRIEYNNGYAVVEGASWNGKRMKKGSFKKRFNGENHGFQVSTWALGGVGKNYKNKWVK